MRKSFICLALFIGLIPGLINLRSGASTEGIPQQPPTFSINDISIAEPASGVKVQAVFTISLTPASSFDEQINYKTADGTAHAPGDYLAAMGSLVFPSGTTSMTVSVSVVGDALGDGDKNFFLDLSLPIDSSDTIGKGRGVCTVRDSLFVCTFSISPTQESFTAAGGAGRIAVSTPTGCRWTAASGVDWAQITSGDAGAGPGAVMYSVSVNADKTPRSGTITVAGIGFTVNQNGPACTFSVDPRSATFDSDGTPLTSGNSVTVLAPDGCNWIASSNNAWIHIPKRTGFSGPGSVELSVDPNNGPVRTGGITIGDQTVTISQAGPGCDLLDVSPTAINDPIEGNPNSEGHLVSVTVSRRCEWKASTGDNWITIIGASGLGPGRFKVKVAVNTAGRRAGTIIIRDPVAQRSLSVSQDGVCPRDSYTLAVAGPTEFDACGSGTGVTVGVTAPPGCAWLPVPGTSWIKIVGVNGAFEPPFNAGVGDGTFDFLVSDNPGGESRYGTIDVAGHRILIGQWGGGYCGDCAMRHVVTLPGPSPDGTLALSRRFRDEVLAKTPRGHRYTDLYYRFSGEAVGLMFAHPSLVLRSRKMLVRYKPAIEALVRGEGATLTHDDLDEIEDFLQAFGSKGGPEMQETIRGLCHDLRDPRVHAEFGLRVVDRTEPGISLANRAGSDSMLSMLSRSTTMYGGILFMCVVGICLIRKGGPGVRSERFLCFVLVLFGTTNWAALPAYSSTSRQVVSIKLPCAGSGPVFSGRASLANPRPAPIDESYAKLPLSFEADQACDSRCVRFSSRAGSQSVALTPNEAILGVHSIRTTEEGLRRRGRGADQMEDRLAAMLPVPLRALRFNYAQAAAAEAPTDPGSGAHRSQKADLRIRLIDADPAARMEGLDELPGKANHYIGNDPSKWRTGVPAYAKVRCRNVYPGVDMVYYGNQGQLEYDLVVAPGSNPDQIRISFDSAPTSCGQAIRIDDQGNLLVQTPLGEVGQRKPIVYQEIDGVRRIVPAEYRLCEPASHRLHKPVTVGFRIGPYDSRKPLIIDPVLAYSTYLGGSGDDEANAIAVDSAGNAYVVGSTNSPDFTTSGASRPAFGGGAQDAFIAKLDPSGARLLYFTYIGGSGSDNGTALALDSDGNAYVIGLTGSLDFPVLNAIQSSNRGVFNAFLTKLGPTGSILYSTLLGGSASDFGSSIAVDSAGSVYLAGIATSRDFPTANAMQRAIGGDADLFVAKLNPSATSLVYSTYLGGSGLDGATSIAVDSGGSVYVTGITSSRDLKTANAIQSAYGGGLFDAFVAKLNPSGSEIDYLTYLGGAGEDRGFRIAVDNAGNAYVAGDTDSSDFPTANALQKTGGGSFDAFVAKIDSTGRTLVYSTYIGGSGIDGAIGIAVNSAGSAYITGYTASVDFPTVSPAQAAYGGGDFDAFVAKLNPSGSSLDYSTYLGGSKTETGFSVAVDSAGSAYVTGLTSSTDFPTAGPIMNGYGGGPFDVFVAKIKDDLKISSAMVP